MALRPGERPMPKVMPDWVEGGRRSSSCLQQDCVFMRARQNYKAFRVCSLQANRGGITPANQLGEIKAHGAEYLPVAFQS
jgi:hypothetical protein